jgi:predicted aspartyl protease
MGLFRTTIEIQNLDRLGAARSLPDTLVDTGSEYTWIPRDVLEGLRIVVERKQGFIVADGRRVDRDIGYALIRAGGSEAPELVVFGEPGDMSLLGAHALEGLNLKIDPVRKALVPAGPVITAGAVHFRYAKRKPGSVMLSGFCASRADPKQVLRASRSG